ncbi:MAG TPA: hypothetical protein VK087_02325 [Tissierellaceae bacterium]|nr:hypothetical protein [Tissierellaceae bacterium]
MNPMIKRFVDQGMMTEEQGEFIEEAIKRKDSIVVSGHRSAGIRPLMASVMGIAKSNFESVQVKDFDSLEKEAEFYLIPGLDGVDFEGIVSEAIAKEDAAFISVKEPEHPISIMKILRQNFKKGTGIGKKIQTIECVKVDDEPKVVKITEMVLNEKGRVDRQDQ